MPGSEVTGSSPLLRASSPATRRRSGGEADEKSATLGQRELSLLFSPNTLLTPRLLYGAWTQNLSHNPPHACGASDAAGVAAVSGSSILGWPDEPVVVRDGSLFPVADRPVQRVGRGSGQPHAPQPQAVVRWCPLRKRSGTAVFAESIATFGSPHHTNQAQSYPVYPG